MSLFAILEGMAFLSLMTDDTCQIFLYSWQKCTLVTMKTGILLFGILLLTSQELVGQRSEAQGGAALLDHSSVCITKAQSDAISRRLEATIVQLREAGVVPEQFLRGAPTVLNFPLQWSPGFDDYGFHGISNYVDHDPVYPGSIQDYSCGARSYDTQSGYNHPGIDYFLWPFAWNLVEEDAVAVIAAAAGTIIGKDDGNEHTSCGSSSADWNAVYLLHDDGSTTWYGHLKKFSLTTKQIGETVEAGEFLGIVASSGNSTGPHLHFEVHDVFTGDAVDPYAGPCNTTTTETWWNDQHPYKDPRINKIQTHFAPPNFNTCPNPSILNDADVFVAGDLVYFATYFKDQSSTDLCQFSIIQPNEQIFDVWTFYQPQAFFNSSWWYWSNYIPSDPQEGIWTFQCVFAGRTYSHEFEVRSGVSSVDHTKPEAEHYYTTVNQSDIRLNAESHHLFSGLVRITDMNGRNIAERHVVFNEGRTEITISCEDFSSGIYFLTMLDEHGMLRFSDKLLIE